MTFDAIVSVSLLGLSVFSSADRAKISLAGIGFMVIGAMIENLSSLHGRVVLGPPVPAMLTTAILVYVGCAVIGVLLSNAQPVVFAIATLAFSLAAALVWENGVGIEWSGTAFMRHNNAIEVVTLAVCVAICYASYRSRFAFAAQALAAAMSGILFPAISGSIPGGTFVVAGIALAVAAAVIGGRGTALGPVIGALVLAFAAAIFRPMTDQVTLIAGFLMLAVLVWAPDGCFGLAQRSYRAFLARGARGAA